MHNVEIFHNVHPDAYFGLNTVFVPAADPRDAKQTAATPAERHPLVKVFEYEVDNDGSLTPAVFVSQVLDVAFETFNIGEAGLAQAYRARRLRSLSVGDVVVIDGRAHSCESAGWQSRQAEELRIVEADDAVALIRERFEFRPAETLTVTVPWENPAEALVPGGTSADQQLQKFFPGLDEEAAGQKLPREPAEITVSHWSMLDVLPARDGDGAPDGATHTLFHPDGSLAGYFTPVQEEAR